MVKDSHDLLASPTRRPAWSVARLSVTLCLSLLTAELFTDAVVSAAPPPRNFEPAGTVDKVALEKAVNDAITKGCDYLWSKQNTTTVLLFRNIFTGDRRVVRVPNAKWGDVVIVKNSTTVRIKGQEYNDIECVIPPGWFDPEPPGSNFERDPNAPVKEGYGDVNPWYGGTSCLATLALLTARAYKGNPMKDERMKMAIECCLNIHMLDPGGERSRTAPPTKKAGVEEKPPKQLVQGVQSTYVLGVHAPALEMALRRGVTGPLETQIRNMLAEDYRRLAYGLEPDVGRDKSGWLYMPNLPGNVKLGRLWKWDLSNTQYGILAIWAAARAGIEMPDERKLWEHLNQLLCENQKHGGWGYSPTYEPEPSPNMTIAGIASLFVVLDQHWTRMRGARGPDITPLDTHPLLISTLTSIDNGLEYFGRTYRFQPDAYFLYGVERIGAASGYKYFGGHDWFLDCAQNTIRSQTPDGEFRMLVRNAGGGGVIATSLCLLFLAHGRGPVLVNKLSYGPPKEFHWHNYPRDVANLIRWYDENYEIDGNWQVVTLQKDKEDDLLDAPVLYINGYRAINLTEEEVDMLRRYVERGGTLLFVVCGGKIQGRPFLDSCTDLARRLYPKEKFPEYRLEKVPKEHPVLTGLGDANNPKTKGKNQVRTEMWHVHNGHRSFMFVVPQDINHIWQSNRRATQTDAFALFANVRNYGTDKEIRDSRFRPPPTAGYPRVERRGDIQLGVVQYTSGGQLKMEVAPGSTKTEDVATIGDWAAAGSAWAVYKDWLLHATGYDLKEDNGLPLTDPRIKNCDVLHMTGHYAIKLTNRELVALKDYLDSGGTLYIDCIGGRDIEGKRGFYESVRNLLRDLFKGEPLQNIGLADPIITGKTADGETFGFNCAEANYTRAVKLKFDYKTPVLQTIRIKGRPAVIVSQFDLTCGMAGINYWEREGYQPKTARELVANILISARNSRGATVATP